MYHKTKAKKGQLFTEEEVEKLSDEWVDTPAKFKEQKKKVTTKKKVVNHGNST